MYCWVDEDPATLFIRERSGAEHSASPDVQLGELLKSKKPRVGVISIASAGVGHLYYEWLMSIVLSKYMPTTDKLTCAAMSSISKRGGVWCTETVDKSVGLTW